MATDYALNGYEGENPAPGEDLPEITADREPRQFEEESTVCALVQLAGEAGVIKRLEGMDVDSLLQADDDGGYYYFRVDLGRHIYATLLSYGQ